MILHNIRIAAVAVIVLGIAGACETTRPVCKGIDAKAFPDGTAAIMWNTKGNYESAVVEVFAVDADGHETAAKIRKAGSDSEASPSLTVTDASYVLLDDLADGRYRVDVRLLEKGENTAAPIGDERRGGSDFEVKTDRTIKRIRFLTADDLGLPADERWDMNVLLAIPSWPTGKPDEETLDAKRRELIEVARTVCSAYLGHVWLIENAAELERIRTGRQTLIQSNVEPLREFAANTLVVVDLRPPLGGEHNAQVMLDMYDLKSTELDGRGDDSYPKVLETFQELPDYSLDAVDNTPELIRALRSCMHELQASHIVQEYRKAVTGADAGGNSKALMDAVGTSEDASDAAVEAFLFPKADGDEHGDEAKAKPSPAPVKPKVQTTPAVAPKADGPGADAGAKTDDAKKKKGS